MWTGDNLGTWEHMAVGVKMVLANGLGGLSFAGCKYSIGCTYYILLTTYNNTQPMLGAFSVTLNQRCLYGGTKSALLLHSLELMPILTLNVGNPSYWMSLTRASSRTSFASVTPSCRCGTLSSVRRVSPVCPS